MITELKGINGRALVINMSGQPGDSATCQVHLTGRGSRGSTRATALYVASNSRMLRGFALGARNVLVGKVWHATIARGRGGLRIKPHDLGIEVQFNGRRGSTVWSEIYRHDAVFGFASAENVVQAIEQSAAHLKGDQ